MASRWWARGAVALSAAVALAVVLLCIQAADTAQSGGKDVTARHLALDRRKREGPLVITSQQTEKDNEIHPRRRKGRRKKKHPNGTAGFRKRKKGLRRWNQSSAGVLMPNLEPGIVGNTIIRTSEGDGPQNRLLIQTLRQSNSSGVRYFANYPLQWREHRGPTLHQTSPVLDGDSLLPPRYGDTYLKWRGLRYGKFQKKT